MHTLVFWIRLLSFLPTLILESFALSQEDACKATVTRARESTETNFYGSQLVKSEILTPLAETS